MVSALAPPPPLCFNAPMLGRGPRWPRARAACSAPAFAALVAFASGCGDAGAETSTPAADAGPQMPAGGLLDWAVDELGPFRVGYRTLETAYAPPGGGADRTLVVNVWYPTLDTEGVPPAYLHAFQDPDVLEGATLAPPVEPAGYPVHVYSHGHWGFGGTSSDLMHWFASHGWVAVAPDHAGNTLPEHIDGPLPIAMDYFRPMDISASLDALEALDPADPLAGKCRTDRVLMSGHSRGTVTTWAAGGAAFDTVSIQAMCDAGAFAEPCTPADLAVFAAGLGDARVVAAIPMAGGVAADEPGWFGMTGYDAAAKPFMLMSGSADPVGAENVWARVTALDLTWLDFAGGCHQLFGLGGCPELEENEGWRLVDTYALSFARRHVLGDQGARVAAILDGSEVLSPKVGFEHK